MGYLLFLLVTGVLYIRPTDLHPALYQIPLYEILIIPCLIITAPAMAASVSPQTLQERPISACLIGFIFAATASSLVYSGFGTASDFTWGLSKTVIYYFLAVSQITTPERLRRYFYALVFFYLVGALLALAQFHGYVDIQTMRVLEEIKGQKVDRRLRGSGLFGDANDVCLNLSCGIMLALYGLGDRRLGLLRWSWVLPLIVFAYSIRLTQSRGGLLAVITGLGTLSLARYGLRKGLILAALAVVLVIGLTSGRQASLSTLPTSGTGQQRVQMAFEALSFFLMSPLLGIGPNHFEQHTGHVVHNTYAQIMAEIGFFGGLFFLGAYFHAVWTLLRLRPGRVMILDPEMRRARLYALATVAAYGGGMLTLTECYIVPTYAILGIAAVTIGLARSDPPLTGLRFDAWFLVRSALVVVAFVALSLAYTRFAVNW
jgi:O-antigen ligase